MLDILLEVVAELFGLKTKKPQSQPRRRVRPPSTGGSDASSASTPQRTVTEMRPTPPSDMEDNGGFEDMVKQLFGVPVEDEEPPPSSRRPAPVAQTSSRPRPQVQVRRTRKVVKRNEDGTAIVVEEARSTQPVVSPPRSAYRPIEIADVVEALPAAMQTSSSSTDQPVARKVAVPDYVARLQANPNAAREAFVYAEIFGPPLADR